MSKDSTLNSLRMLANQNSTFDDPFDKEVVSKKPTFEKRPKKKQTVEAFIEESEEYLKDAADNRDFDAIVDVLDYEDDDLELRDSILSMGRKYARDYTTSKDESEVSKAFAPQEARLNDIYSTLSKEAMKLEEDINEMRMMRSRNYGKISDMVEVKGSIISNQLNVIKELNNIKKTQFDIRNKMKADASADSDGSAAATSVIQSIFGMGHDALLSGVGGRSGSSGAYDPDEESNDFENSDTYGEMIINQNSDDAEETDGDKFLKYEGQNIRLVLEEDDSGNRSIHAEDDEGNVIDDYPIANNVNELQFDINQKTNTATDQLQRKYEYRSI